MFPFVESIRLQNGDFDPGMIKFHYQRMKQTVWHHYRMEMIVDLSQIISCTLPDEVVKCRVLYDYEIRDIEYLPYRKRDIRSVRLVFDDDIDYSYKFTDRSRLNALFEKRGDCDDIIIVKNDLITDAYSANLAFYDGEEWVTPDSYLLNGTRRQYLLDWGLLRERRISVSDIDNYEKFCFLNAMLDFGETSQECKAIVR